MSYDPRTVSDLFAPPTDEKSEVMLAYHSGQRQQLCRADEGTKKRACLCRVAVRRVSFSRTRPRS